MVALDLDPNGGHLGFYLDCFAVAILEVALCHLALFRFGLKLFSSDPLELLGSVLFESQQLLTPNLSSGLVQMMTGGRFLPTPRLLPLMRLHLDRPLDGNILFCQYSATGNLSGQPTPLQTQEQQQESTLRPRDHE